MQTKKTLLKIGGMHCAGCVNSIQRYVSTIDGVSKVEVNLASEKAAVEFDPEKTSLPDIEKAVEGAGYRVVYEKVSLKIGGMSDPADAQRIEQAVSRMEGVRSASANYGNSQVMVQYSPALVSLADVRRKIGDQGYSIAGESAQESATDVEARRLWRVFLAGLAFTVPAVLFSYPEVFSFIPLAATDAGAYIAFAAASIVQFAAGGRFYVGAFRIARMKSANMDTLVVLGTTAAYAFSAYNTFPSPMWHGIYYDASSLVITFILLGKYLELKTKGRTGAVIRKMLELQPKAARVKKADGSEVETPVELIQPGDIIIVRPGEKVPVDSTVVQGESAVDESMATGESVPVHKKADDSAIGGTVNREGMLLVKATKVGADSFLSQVVRLVEEAMGKKPAMQKLVDTVAGYFAYAVMAVALATFAAWYALASPGSAQAAIIPAVAILVVACPCALGLATPTAIMVGMGKGAANGVIFKSGDAIEALSKVKVAVFDKTGTLTLGRPQVTDVVQVQVGVAGGTQNADVLALAATAENYSEHPLARAIMGHAKSAGIEPRDVSDFQVTAGMGVTAVMDGTAIRVGSIEFMENARVYTAPSIKAVEELQAQGKTAVLVSAGSDVVGIIGMLDAPKPGAREAMAALRDLGIEPVMVTGDNRRTAEEIARQVGIERVYAGVLPSGKVDAVSELRKSGRVAMIGDGINDAPALTAADVGMAIGSGTDLAIEAGSVVLVRNDIRDVVSAVEIARKTVGKIKQNLAYAFLYNVVLIPVAAAGLLYPALAGLAMAASSVSVTASSLALKRWKPRASAALS
ncbi:heavy metal translocating P-type ATPase [Candidatus Nitrososphaera sp. FF02]|uniref:heavy metal translocating P-type ATPase n=1 Tax=Candidatus Nitrososphaera sp. FF02 TaxID=3398226 RepID=UPI0039E84317